MKILLIGGGGREHALAWKIKQSPQAEEIFCAPGNAGTAGVAKNVAIPADDIEQLLQLVVDDKLDIAAGDVIRCQRKLLLLTRRQHRPEHGLCEIAGNHLTPHRRRQDGVPEVF